MNWLTLCSKLMKVTKFFFACVKVAFHIPNRKRTYFQLLKSWTLQKAKWISLNKIYSSRL